MNWGRAFWKLFFANKRAFQFFFLDFLRSHPKIINGRPLRGAEQEVHQCSVFSIFLEHISVSQHENQ